MRFIGPLAFLCLFTMLSLAFSYFVFRRTIKAQEFVVKDSQGKVRGTLGLIGLSITGGDGTLNVRLAATAKGEVLLMTDADGKVRVYLDSMPDVKTTMLSLAAEGGTVDVEVSPIGREVDLQDEFGGSHATLEPKKHGSSVTLGYSDTEEQGIMTTNGIGFYDTKGRVIYAAGK